MWCPYVAVSLFLFLNKGHKVQHLNLYKSFTFELVRTGGLYKNICLVPASYHSFPDSLSCSFFTAVIYFMAFLRLFFLSPSPLSPFLHPPPPLPRSTSQRFHLGSFVCRFYFVAAHFLYNLSDVTGNEVGCMGERVQKTQEHTCAFVYKCALRTYEWIVSSIVFAQSLITQLANKLES